MRKLILYLRQCFCKHNFTEMMKIKVYMSEEDESPTYYKYIYHCDKCGYTYTLKY